MLSDEMLAQRILDGIQGSDEGFTMGEVEDACRRLLAACEARKILDEIERRNAEGYCVSIHYDDNGGYSIGGAPAKPTILEAWEAFEGRQR